MLKWLLTVLRLHLIGRRKLQRFYDENWSYALDEMPEFTDGESRTKEVTLETVQDYILSYPVGSGVFLPPEYFAVLLDYFASIGIDTSRVDRTVIFTWLERRIELGPF